MGPKILILGGIGFVGRNLVSYLLKNGNQGSDIRVVDKVLPPTAWLSAVHKAAMDQVEFKQANLVIPGNEFYFECFSIFPVL
jgi:nucleoside-diphosphate-sugar epimerase